jgi:hypothetical protein
MTTHLLRRIAIVLIAFYAFGQASIAMAGCGMDRGEMAQAMAWRAVSRAATAPCRVRKMWSPRPALRIAPRISS